MQTLFMSALTGLARTVKTNDEGDYTVPLLPPGTYSVTVLAPGFKTQTSSNIHVQVGSTVTVNIKLQLGQASEKVIVEAAAEILHTENATNGAIVNDKTGEVVWAAELTHRGEQIKANLDTRRAVRRSREAARPRSAAGRRSDNCRST